MHFSQKTEKLIRVFSWTDLLVKTDSSNWSTSETFCHLDNDQNQVLEVLVLKWNKRIGMQPRFPLPADSSETFPETETTCWCDANTIHSALHYSEWTDSSDKRVQGEARGPFVALRLILSGPYGVEICLLSADCWCRWRRFHKNVSIHLVFTL